MSDALITALSTNPLTYQAVNPTTTPDDYKLLLEAISKMPERPAGLVRLRENDPGINGTINVDNERARKTGEIRLSGPPEIHISRLGPNYQSKDPWRIAGTIHHENTHLQGASEAEAREHQRKFIADAMASGRMRKDKRYLADVTDSAKHFGSVESARTIRRLTRDEDMERELLLQALNRNPQ